MKLYDMVVFIPGVVTAFAAKMIKNDILESSKDTIVEKKLYHFSSKENIDKILESGYIKTSDVFTSYGKKVSFMFAGLPSINSLLTNLNTSPVIDARKVYYAVEMEVNKEELVNYKTRLFSDEAILYRGNCVFDNDRAKAVQVVVDLKRDENGNPILDKNTGKPIGFELRKAKENEIDENNPELYSAKQDYLEYIDEVSKENVFISKDGKFSQKFPIVANMYNTLNLAISAPRAELENIAGSTKKNFTEYIKSKVNSIGNKVLQIDEPSDSKINRILRGKSFLQRKEPYADIRFAQFIGKLNNQGLKQINLQSELPQFVNSGIGKFLRQKREQIDKTPIRKHGIHGINHIDRVAMLSLMIGKEEGILTDETTKELDILLYSAYYHDIGRILDSGPHAVRSANKIKKQDLYYIDGKPFSDEDKRIVEFLAEGHEDKFKVKRKMSVEDYKKCESQEMEKLLDKYEIPEEKRELAKSLLKVVKDADALDRARLASKGKMNLNPDYLRLDSSKRFMEASYGLECLTSQLSIENILNYGKQKTYEKVTQLESSENDFDKRIRVDNFTRRLQAFKARDSKMKEKSTFEKNDDEKLR